MAHAEWEDLGEFLESEEFASIARVTVGAASRDVVGIFNDPFVDPEIGGSGQIDAEEPTFLCRTSDCTGIVRGCLVEVAGGRYFALGTPQRDGTGLSLITLASEL